MVPSNSTSWSYSTEVDTHDGWNASWPWLSCVATTTPSILPALTLLMLTETLYIRSRSGPILQMSKLRYREAKLLIQGPTEAGFKPGGPPPKPGLSLMSPNPPSPGRPATSTVYPRLEEPRQPNPTIPFLQSHLRFAISSTDPAARERLEARAACFLPRKLISKAPRRGGF